MNILFVIDRQFNKYDPNINLIKNILPYFNAANVYFIGHDTDKKNISENCFYYSIDEKVRNLYFSLSSLSVLKKASKLILHPVLSLFGLLKCFNLDLISFFYKKNIERFCNSHNIDCAISISAPFYTAKGLAKANIKCKKAIIMFDPYAYHYSYRNKRTIQQENACIKKVSAVFVPSLIKKHYTQANVQSFEFPGIIIDNNKEIYELYNKSKINLAYVGSLYADIRSPEYLYQLLEKADTKHIHLTIVGKVYGQFSKDFYLRYAQFLQNHVTFVGEVDSTTAHKYIANADVLVNIGNMVDNMLPSKVLEYISTLKPVLNIAQIRNCPSIPYFDQYNNSLTIFNNDDLDESAIERFESFVNNRKSVEAEDVVNKFKQATPSFVANQILSVINTNIKENK